MDSKYEQINLLALEIAKNLLTEKHSINQAKKICQDQAFELAYTWFDNETYRKSKYFAKKVKWNDLKNGRAKRFLDKDNEYWILPQYDSQTPVKARPTEIFDDYAHFALYENGTLKTDYQNVIYCLLGEDNERILNETPPHVEYEYNQDGIMIGVNNTMRE